MCGTEDGFILINKPAGPTSHDVVDKLRAVTGIRKIGHAGTLDPFAEGLLILLIGKYTKRQNEFMHLPKKYEAELKLGIKSDTHDIEGRIEEIEGALEPSKEDIAAALEKFTGKIKQIPPQFSAVKVGGKRAYKEARAGRELKLEPRAVEIYGINILQYRYPLLRLSIKCSKGTYIRALARDLGEELQTDALLTALKRTEIGEYELKDAVDLNNINSFDWSEFLRVVPD